MNKEFKNKIIKREKELEDKVYYFTYSYLIFFIA